MIDGKMASILQGDSGSPCHYCDLTVAEINDMINIINGFTINKSFETCQKAWTDLEEDMITWSNPERK